MTRETWLDAARELRKAGRMLRRVGGSWTPGRYVGPIESPDVCEAIYFAWGGAFSMPLHDDFNIGTSGLGRKCTERAAQVCESLAYDGTDGP